LTEQNGWPVRSWYFPSGQSGQETEFDTLENFPTPHASQMRFEVLLGLVPTFEPAAHMVCSTQNVLPTSLWSCPAAHEVHSNKFEELENFPAAQSEHLPGSFRAGLES
jgi:hypothetical protein